MVGIYLTLWHCRGDCRCIHGSENIGSYAAVIADRHESVTAETCILAVSICRMHKGDRYRGDGSRNMRAKLSCKGDSWDWFLDFVQLLVAQECSTTMLDGGLGIPKSLKTSFIFNKIMSQKCCHYCGNEWNSHKYQDGICTLSTSPNDSLEAIRITRQQVAPHHNL